MATMSGRPASSPTRREKDLETWFIRGGSAGAALYTFLQPGIYAYVTHNLIEAVELGATAHFKVEGKWNDDLMTQVKPPGRSAPAITRTRLQSAALTLKERPAPFTGAASLEGRAMLIAFKIKLRSPAAAGLAGTAGLVAAGFGAGSRLTASATTCNRRGSRRAAFAYRVAGDFTRAGKQAEAPLRDRASSDGRSPSCRSRSARPTISVASMTAHAARSIAASRIAPIALPCR